MLPANIEEERRAGPSDRRERTPWPAECPFLAEGENAFIKRFVTMEICLVSLTTQVVYLRNTLVGAVVAVVCSIVAAVVLRK